MGGKAVWEPAEPGLEFRPLPGAPNNPKGWKVGFPALQEGMPLNPVLTMTSSRRVDSTVSFPEGDGVDNNLFTRYMKALIGIERLPEMNGCDRPICKPFRTEDG